MSKPAQSEPSTETTLPKSKIAYGYDENTHAITRTDAQGKTQILATLKEGVLEWESDDAKKYHAPVIRFLGDEGLKHDTISVKGAARDMVNESEIPKKPKGSIEKGDKDPVVVEWYKKYKPEEYKQRYGIKGEGQVTKIIKDVHPETGRPRKKYVTVDATLARRKTHLTEKAAAEDQDE